jgi:predicted nucleic acid-binding protein
MASIIDSSLWIDYFRAKTPALVKQQVVAEVDNADALLCVPVQFEIVRAALRSERSRVQHVFATVPLLSQPPDLWREATALGQRCLDAGIQTRSLDLLIAQVALHHHVEIVTFDSHFAAIAKASALKVRLLIRVSSLS